MTSIADPDDETAEALERIAEKSCERCPTIMLSPTHTPCCSSHGKNLCCTCYRRTHFVEVGPCCANWIEED